MYARRMPVSLRPCPSCGRHVRVEAVCPFCEAPLPARGVVARVAFGVALAASGVATASCIGGVYGGPPPDLYLGRDTPVASATTDDAGAPPAASSPAPSDSTPKP